MILCYNETKNKASPIVVLALQTTYNVVFIEEVTAVLATMMVGEAVAVIEAHDKNLCRNFEHGHEIDVEAQTCEYGSM